MFMRPSRGLANWPGKVSSMGRMNFRRILHFTLFPTAMRVERCGFKKAGRLSISITLHPSNPDPS